MEGMLSTGLLRLVHRCSNLGKYEIIAAKSVIFFARDLRLSMLAMLAKTKVCVKILLSSRHSKFHEAKETIVRSKHDEMTLDDYDKLLYKYEALYATDEESSDSET